MHPALRLEELARLPLAVRKFATAAAGGSEPDMIKLILRIMFQPTTSAQYLPPLFTNLNPARFPPLELLDIPTPAPSAVRAIEAVGEVHSIFAGGIWIFLQLIRIYRPLLPHLTTAHTLRARFLGLLYPMLKDHPTMELVHATPGVYAFVARTWAGMALGLAPGVPRAPLLALNQFLGDMATLTRANFDELIAGAREISQGSSCGTSTLQGALLPAGLVKTLTAALFPICETVLEGMEAVLFGCLEILIASLRAESAYPRLPEAIDAGHLRAIVTFGRTRNTARNRAKLEASTIFPYWLEVLGLVGQRALVLQEFESADHISCDVVKKAPKSSAVLAVACVIIAHANFKRPPGEMRDIENLLASSPHDSHSPKAAPPRNSAPSLITRMTRGHAYRPAKHELNQMGEFVQERAEGNNNASGSKMPGAEADNVRLMDTEVGEYGGGPERYGDESKTESELAAANELWDAAFSVELHHLVVGGVANAQATTLPGWFLTSSSSAEPSSFQATSSSSQHQFRKMCGFRSSAPRDGHLENGKSLERTFARLCGALSNCAKIALKVMLHAVLSRSAWSAARTWILMDDLQRAAYAPASAAGGMLVSLVQSSSRDTYARVLGPFVDKLEVQRSNGENDGREKESSAYGGDPIMKAILVIQIRGNFWGVARERRLTARKYLNYEAPAKALPHAFPSTHALPLRLSFPFHHELPIDPMGARGFPAIRVSRALYTER
ncbi:hypothetical protein DFH09DRAFT_1094363 [Mycena vulgaris]|nr:hypothetical protein DFH09DRAFT_1094363 [Mycena vulgaris]